MASICSGYMKISSVSKKDTPHINETSHLNSREIIGQSPCNQFIWTFHRQDYDTSSVYGKKVTIKDKGIAMHDNMEDDHPVTKEIITEEPDIQTNMEKEGEYNIIYPSFYLEYV